MPIITVEIPQLPAVIARFEAAPELVAEERIAAMTDSTFKVEAEIKARTPRKTGRLQAAWHSEVSPDGSLGRISNAVSYAPFVEFGTAAHDIYPVHARALFWPGATHPVAHVHHPGTPAREMAQQGLEAARPWIAARFQRLLQNLINKLAA